MNAFYGVLMVLGLIVAAVFAVGVFCIGVGIMIIAVASTWETDMTQRFVIGIDFGTRYHNSLDRIVGATEKTVQMTEEMIKVIMPKEEGEEEVNDFSDLD